MPYNMTLTNHVMVIDIMFMDNIVFVYDIVLMSYDMLMPYYLLFAGTFKLLPTLLCGLIGHGGHSKTHRCLISIFTSLIAMHLVPSLSIGS